MSGTGATKTVNLDDHLRMRALAELIATGRAPAALRELLPAEAESCTAAGWANLAAALLGSAEWGLARDCALRAAVDAPELWHAWANLLAASERIEAPVSAVLVAECLRRHGKEPAIMEVVEAVLPKLSGDIGERLGVADALREVGALTLARDLLSALDAGSASGMTQAETRAAQHTLLELADTLEDDETVARVAPSVLAEDSDDAAALSALAELAFKYGDDEAVVTMGTTLFLRGRHGRVGWLLACSLQALGRSAEAEAVLGLELSRPDGSTVRRRCEALGVGRPEAALAERASAAAVAIAMSHGRGALTLAASERLAGTMSDKARAGATLVAVGEALAELRAYGHALAAMVMADTVAPGSCSEKQIARLRQRMVP